MKSDVMTIVTALGMMSENMQRQSLGESMAYTESAFQDLLKEPVAGNDLSKISTLISRILDIRDCASGKHLPFVNDPERLQMVKEDLDKLADELNEDENLVIA